MKYEPALDGLRAIAILMVVLFHAFPTAFPGGWMGVDIFFVLSGFLITTILMKERQTTGTISFRNFYARRVLRLLPEAGCLFAFQFVHAIFSPFRGPIITATLVSLFYFMNWSRAFDLFPQDVLGHMWSLSTEEQFYFVWPIILLLIVRRSPASWTVALIAAVLIWRIVLTIRGASIERTYNGFDTHGDALLVGCLLAFVPPAAKALLGRLAWAALGIFLMSFFAVPYDALGMQTIGMTLVAAVAAILISGALLPTAFARILAIPPLVFTGRISYGWYLWHYPILLLGASHGVPKIALIAGSYSIAVVSYFAIARPVSRWKPRHPKVEQPDGAANANCDAANALMTESVVLKKVAAG